MRQHCLAFVALLTTSRRTQATMTQPLFTITYVSLMFAKIPKRELGGSLRVCVTATIGKRILCSRGLQSHCFVSPIQSRN